ncbi:MAG: hypothetical protein E5Y10_24675 [Mesorhizobium sp.]|nr:MAG: hypothetical protein E5Y10_24675 [Mesorhizobium sp.]
MTICSMDGCSKPHRARGWCCAHYQRWLRYGYPLGGGKTRGEAQSYLRDVVLPYQEDGCLVWPFRRNQNGYGQIKHLGQMMGVHRVVCEATNGPPPTPRHYAAHNCGNGHLGCANPSHMSWKTPAENQADRVLHGTHNVGEANGRAKLTQEKADEIRSLAGRVPTTHLGRMYGVSCDTVRAIKLGKRWAT